MPFVFRPKPPFPRGTHAFHPAAHGFLVNVRTSSLRLCCCDFSFFPTHLGGRVVSLLLIWFHSCHSRVSPPPNFFLLRPSSFPQRSSSGRWFWALVFGRLSAIAVFLTCPRGDAGGAMLSLPSIFQSASLFLREVSPAPAHFSGVCTPNPY